MALIKSKQFILGVIGAGATTYAVPAAFIDTVQAFSFHNTSGSLATVTITLNSIQILEALPIPISGNQPTIFYAMLGQRMVGGTTLSITAGTQDVITVMVSGIEEVA